MGLAGGGSPGSNTGLRSKCDSPALPRSLDDVVDQTVSRALELLDVVVPGVKR